MALTQYQRSRFPTLDQIPEEDKNEFGFPTRESGWEFRGFVNLASRWVHYTMKEFTE